MAATAFTQTSDPGVTSTSSASGDHAFVGTHSDGVFSNWLNSGYSATAYNLLGYSNEHAGFGVANGNNIVSPMIWMYNNHRNAFRVRTIAYQGDLTSGNDLFTVRANGNVGIGETNPEHGRLHINGNGSGQGINLWTKSGEVTSRIWIDNQKKTFHLSKGDNPTNGITISNTGLIGIGEVNPEHGRLHINGNGAGQGINLWTHSGETTSRIWIDNQKKTFHLTKGDNPTNGITIDNIGLVGIGTTNPSEKLTINGKMLCEEVKVVADITAPDYVFQKYYTGTSQLKDEYTMPTLEEVEAYTKANHHLPEVPNAQTMQEDGVELKEMSLLLLQKVEELTLYTIEQEKRIKKQDIRIKTLEALLAKQN
ncbi:hypothetical protein MHTCC0001_20480 [Flavobacteriaceae bacterium MHTCC 0001]